MGNQKRSIQQRFGKKVRQLRENRGWSQERFAGECGLHRTYVGGIERGERNPTLKNIYAIAEALGEPLKALFDF
jgi:transcriptional regulator with XRE-family HTH domain